MTKQFDVVSTGECLIDVLLHEDLETNSVKMIGNAGGAPVNVLVALSHLNRSTAYLGKLSKDAFGKYLLRIIKEHDIDTSGIVFTEDHTTLAMVSLSDAGDRDFTFYRQNTADVNYCEADVNLDVINASKIFHFGSVSMTTEPSRSATLLAAKFARENGVKVSFDPNLRPALWDDVANAKPWIVEGLKLADYVKVSEEELSYLTGTDDHIKGAQMLLAEYNFEYLAVTLGADGYACFANGQYVFEPTYQNKCVDTTGSGDACWGATLSRLIEKDCNISNITKEDLHNIACYANAAGSLCASKHGAIYAMATAQEIEQCIRTAPRLPSKYSSQEG